MAQKQHPRPTDAELAILRVLWDRGPSTVRQVHDVASESRSIGYTTTLKLMQIMTEKGLTRRDAEGRSHVYSARFGQEETQRRLLDDLMDRTFSGSAAKLVMQALETRPASDAERDEIRQLIDEKSRNRRENDRD